MDPEDRPRRACTECRDKKIGCLRSKSSDGTCQRCRRLGKHCVTPKSRERPQKTRLANRVVTLEENLQRFEHLFAGWGKRREAGASATPEESISESARTRTATPPRRQDSVPLDDVNDILSQNLVSLDQAEVLLNRFRQMAPHFPYVVIPETTRVSDLRRERPVLLHAILTAASWDDRPLQEKLHREYVKTLTERIFIRTERNMDLLQGLLVHISWCHFHFKYIAYLAAMAVTMVAELHLNKRPRENEKQKLGIEETFGVVRVNSTQDFWNHEARRAFIGCYVISASMSVLVRKICLFKYTDYVEECAASLSTGTDFPSDSTLLHQVRLTRHVEEVADTFGYMGSESNQDMTEEKLQFLVKTFELQLSNIRRSAPTFMASTSSFNAAYHAIDVFDHEIGLHGRKGGLSPSRATILFDCVVAAKNYLDTALTVPSNEMPCWTGVQWVRLHYVVTLLTKLTTGLNSPLWSVESVRRLIKVETYLDQLCTRLREQSERVTSGEAGKDWFMFLHGHWQTLARQCQNGMGAEVSIGGTARPAFPPTSTMALDSYPMIPGFAPIDFMANLGDSDFLMMSDLDSWQSESL